MAEIWQVIGGSGKGGILVREGESLGSKQLASRLSTGALLEEIEHKGERLHFRRFSGTGPEDGWISVKLKGKVLAFKTSSGSVESLSEHADESIVLAKAALAEAATPEIANAALGLLWERCRSPGKCSRPELLLARGLVHWRWSKLGRALEDLEEARLAGGEKAGETLLALQICLGRWPEARQLAVELQLDKATSVVDGWASSADFKFAGGSATLEADESEIFPGVRQVDGYISSVDDVELGVRLFLQVEGGSPKTTQPLVLYFHGNGETVDTYKDPKVFEPLNASAASCLMVDFRGYGFSKGGNGTSLAFLHVDAERVCDALPAFFSARGLPWPWPGRLTLFGRSLGGRIACHLAGTRGELFTGGIVLESAACGSHAPGADPPPEPPLDGNNPMGSTEKKFSKPEFIEAIEASSSFCRELVANVPCLAGGAKHFVHMLGNADKLRGYDGRLLILHGDLDALIPVSHARLNFQAADAATRRLVLLGKGHNDISFDDKYVQALKKFLQGP